MVPVIFDHFLWRPETHRLLEPHALAGCLTTAHRPPSLDTQLHTSKAKLSSILYYVTGHGYGHAVRSRQVIRGLKKARPELGIYVRTTAPEWLFQESVFQFSQATDVGLVQKDSLKMDLDRTLRACQALHQDLPHLIKQETEFVRAHDVRLILGDIPPVSFEIAARAAIASAAIANFTWSSIYRAYMTNRPAFLPLIEEMETFYREATLALTLPYSCGMDVFPRQEAIPWIGRTSSLTKEGARQAFQLPQSATIVLLSFGGLGLDRLPWERLKNLKDFFFVTTGQPQRELDNGRFLPEPQAHYEDLVRAADVIVTKPGYGIVADALAHRVPLLYTNRGEFPEYARLVEALEQCATAAFISQEQLLTGNLEPHLTRLLNKERRWPVVPLNGAEIAAEKILALCDSAFE
jgi:L-arabinokinase